jgi:hypothetical protein
MGGRYGRIMDHEKLKTRFLEEELRQNAHTEFYSSMERMRKDIEYTNLKIDDLNDRLSSLIHLVHVHLVEDGGIIK